MTNYRFKKDIRLGILLPELDLDWAAYSEQERAQIMCEWEVIRGSIPDQIMKLERDINQKQTQLYEEEDFEQSCRINSEIAELASQINDLNIWFRLNQETSVKTHQ